MASASGCERGRDGRSSPGDDARAEHGCRPDPDVPDRRFPRSSRLTARKQFLEVYDRGRRMGSSSFVVFAMPNDVGWCRLGLTVTKKTGKAVDRNRIKRKLREAFRRHRERLDVPFDLVINARRRVLTQPLAGLERELLRTVATLGNETGH